MYLPLAHTAWPAMLYRCPLTHPEKVGLRIKTEKRDKLMLVQLLKAGDVDPIYVPEKKAIRDLFRLCDRAMNDLKAARSQLKAML